MDGARRATGLRGDGRGPVDARVVLPRDAARRGSPGARATRRTVYTSIAEHDGGGLGSETNGEDGADDGRDGQAQPGRQIDPPWTDSIALCRNAAGHRAGFMYFISSRGCGWRLRRLFSHAVCGTGPRAAKLRGQRAAEPWTAQHVQVPVPSVKRIARPRRPRLRRCAAWRLLVLAAGVVCFAFRGDRPL